VRSFKRNDSKAGVKKNVDQSRFDRARSTAAEGAIRFATVTRPPTPMPAVIDQPIVAAPTKVRTWLGRSLLFLGTAITAATVGSLLAVTIPLPGAVSPGVGQRLLGDLIKNGFQYHFSRPITVLVMGIDGVPNAQSTADVFTGRSDTMLLIQLDPTKQTINMLSVPRDTQVEIPGIGVTKINQANASGGPILARDTLSNTLNGIQIDRYVRVSTEAFRELVDLLGGVRMYVPKPMKYQDKTQKLNIDLQPGWQTLNGDQAEQFARFRNDNFGDIGRVQRQQTLLKAIKDQVSNPLTIARIPSILQAMQKYIDTNLSLEEMLALVNMGLKLDQKDFKMVLLPGRFSKVDEFKASYWILNPQERDRIMQEYFAQDPANNPANEVNPDAPEKRLRIAVQNATSDPNAASKVATYLLKLGYDNVFVIDDPWDDPQDQTHVIVQGGQLKSAQAVQTALQFGTIDAASTGDLESDLTIRVGNDWQKLAH
jgi:polyisoprenyl-teichoic acid--peptidoglycan teichoic acid transferase